MKPMYLHARPDRSHPGMHVGMYVCGSIDPHAAPWTAIDQDGVRRPGKSGAKPPSPSTECRTNGNRRTEVDCSPNRESWSRWCKDNERIVSRHVDHTWIDRKDLDVAALIGYVTVTVRYQIAVSSGLPAHPLHRIHHVRSLRQDCIAKLLRPSGVARHHIENRGESKQAQDAGIPLQVIRLDSLGQRISFQVAVLIGPACGIRNLAPVSGSGEDLCQ